MEKYKFLIIAYISLFVIVVIILVFVMPGKNPTPDSGDSSYPPKDNFSGEREYYEQPSYSDKSNTKNFRSYGENDEKNYNVNSRFINNLNILDAWELYKATHLDNMQNTFQTFRDCLYALYLITKVANKEDFTHEEMELLSDYDDSILKKIKILNNELFNDLFVKPLEYERLLSSDSCLFTIRWKNKDYNKIHNKPSYKKTFNIFRILTRNNADEFLPSDIKETVFKIHFNFEDIWFSPIDFMLFNWLLFMANPFKP